MKVISQQQGRGITLEQLRTFVLISEQGGFARAGEMLGRTQSTLSIALKRLEAETGCRLIARRQGHIIGLTVEGEQLLPVARDICERVQRLAKLLQRPSLQGRIRLGVPDDFPVNKLHQVLRWCMSENPNLRVEIIAAASPQLQQLSKDDALDMLIYKKLAVDAQAENDHIIQREPLCWVAAAGVESHSMQATLPLVTFPPGCTLRQCAENALRRAGREYYPVYSSASFDNVRRAVASNIGISLLPQSAIQDGMARLADDSLPSTDDITLILEKRRRHALCEDFAAYLLAGLHE